MDAKSVIKTALQTSAYVMSAYLEELSEDELFMRPADNANTLAWQLGHLITTENSIANAIKSGSAPALPEGFSACYTKETCAVDDKSKFHSKEDYVRLLTENRTAIVALLESLTDEELSADGPEPIRSFAPKVADAILMMGSHYMMHSGQIAVMRRKLEKPIVI